MLSKKLVHILVDAVFPSKCLICDTFIEQMNPYGPDRSTWNRYFSATSIKDLKLRHDMTEQLFKDFFQTILGAMICPTCISLFAPVHSPLCTHCGVSFKSKAVEDHQCESCIKAPKRFHKARAFGIYDRSIMELIHCFKYRGKTQLVSAFGAMLLLSYLWFWNDNEVDVIIPVPLHKARFQKRGFNQSYLIIKTWERMRIVSFPLPHPEREVLLRKRPTPPQTGLGRKERIRNISNAFHVSDPERIDGKHILLVDDVYTTGATVDECSKELLKSGAERVDVLTLARAI